MHHHFTLGYHSVYVQNWRVICAIWVLFAVCVSVLQILVLIHPAWIGSDEGGYFGLYDYCPVSECTWRLFQVRPLSVPFQVAAVLVLIATVLSFIAVLSILLLVLLRHRYVLLMCSWMHLFAFLAMLVGCTVYPYGWENPRVREICESTKYSLGLCRLRWPYILALVLLIDQMCLSILGFALACRQPPKIPELHQYTDLGEQPIPRPRKLSVQDSFYSKNSRMEM